MSKRKKIKGSEGMHQNLVDRIYDLYHYVGATVYKNIEYNKGELDIYLPKQKIILNDDIYLEVKCTNSYYGKAYKQVGRAIENNQCTKGALVTYDNFYAFKHK